MIEKQTIEKFFQGTCSAEELVLVLAYLEADEGSIKGLITESEWEQFTTEQQLPDNISVKLWNKISSDTRRGETKVVYLKRMIAAAAILLILGLGWKYFQSTLYINNAGEENKLIAKRIVYTNPHSKIEQVLLPDSSIVNLYPGGTIDYPEFFNNQGRSLVLSGVANFQIKKDTARAFNIYSDSIITTVLGTTFTIDAQKDSSKLIVYLHEGKIAVRHTALKLGQFSNGFTLYPGNVFTYDKIPHLATLSANVPTEKKEQRINKKINYPASIGIQGNNWYMFNNQPLYQVFDYLEQLYKLEISYNKEDLSGKTFVGKIDKNDSPESILQSIALLNNLVLKNEGNNYILTKPKD